MGSEESAAYGEGYSLLGDRLGELGALRGDVLGAYGGLVADSRAATERYNRVVDDLLGTSLPDMFGGTMPTVSRVAPATAPSTSVGGWTESNPYLEPSIEASWDRADRMMGRSIGGTGGLNQAASASGNMASSRAGVAEGVARSEWADSAHENELAMRLASHEGAMNRALSARGQDVDMRGQDLNYSLGSRGQDVTMRGQDMSNLNSMLGAATDMYRTRAGLASGLASSAADTGALITSGLGAMGGLYGLEDGAMAGRLGFASGMPGGSTEGGNEWVNLLNAWNIIGSSPWGSTATGSETERLLNEQYGWGESRGSSYGRDKGTSGSTGFSFSPFGSKFA
jgi:hypothetical protein